MEMDLASLQSVRDFAEQYAGPVACDSGFQRVSTQDGLAVSESSANRTITQNRIM